MQHLQHLAQQARNAFYWTSFDPDKRGKQTIDEHESQLQSDLESIPENEHERYISKYVELFAYWLSAHSRCASSAITGGSGFNVRKAEKANNAEHNAYQKFDEWKDNAKKAIAKRIEQNKPEAQKRSEAWERLERQILSSAATIHGINKGLERGYSKALFVSSIYQHVEVFAKKGDFETVQLAIDCIRKFNETMSVVITERHKFFKLAERAEIKKETIEERAEKENQELLIIGGKVVYNYAIDRLQLLFDEKPSYNIISSLKKNGFRWAPSETAWQRQLTGNAIYSTKYFLKENNLFIPKP